MQKIKKLFPILLAVVSAWNIIFVVLSFIESSYKGKLNIDPLLYNPNMKLILPFVLLIIFVISFYFSYACYYDFKVFYGEWEKQEGEKKQEMALGALFYVMKFFYIQGVALFVTLIGAEQLSQMILGIAGL